MAIVKHTFLPFHLSKKAQRSQIYTILCLYICHILLIFIHIFVISIELQHFTDKSYLQKYYYRHIKIISTWLHWQIIV